MRDYLVAIGAGFVKLLTWCIVFALPLKPMVAGIAFLTIMNLITGIWKARHTDVPFQWLGIIHTTLKLLAYQVALLLTFVAETIFFNGLPLAQVVGGFIAVAELKSGLENLHTVTGLDFWSNVKALFKRSGKGGGDS